MYLKHEIGKLGEDLAAKYLENNNYKILERNFECKQGEIDIIAKDKNELVFIEVKTRSKFTYGNPADAVDERKRKHIYKSAKYYIHIRNLEDEFIRIDVVEVYIYKKRYKINHIKQII